MWALLPGLCMLDPLVGPIDTRGNETLLIEATMHFALFENYHYLMTKEV